MLYIGVIEKNADIGEIIAQKLSVSGFSSMLVTPYGVKSAGDGEDAVVISSPSPGFFSCSPPEILVVSCKDDVSQLSPRVAIVLSPPPSLPLADEIVSCGFGSRDTVTLSSLDTGSSLLALQRRVTLHGHGFAEPMELTIDYSGHRLSETMLAAAALLCAGVPPESL